MSGQRQKDEKCEKSGKCKVFEKYGKSGKTGKYKKYGKYGICVGAGILLFLAAELSGMGEQDVENGVLRRNPCGKGDAVYEFYVDGLEEGRIEAEITVPERRLTEEEFHKCIPAAMELLCSRMLGENTSLSEVQRDLELVRNIPEYGISVSWESEQPELISHMGLINTSEIPGEGVKVTLKARLSSGTAEENVDIPVTVLPMEKTGKMQFIEELDALVLENGEADAVRLPSEFNGNLLVYRKKDHFQNAVLVVLGAAAAGCLYLKEKQDEREEKKKREDRLISDYPDIVSGFLVLTGAGYSIKQAWKKLLLDQERSGSREKHPAYEEMRIAVNQMDTGASEVQAYADFGRRCGLRCYMKFSSLLESCLHTGGKNLRRLLEAEMEEAFRARADLARRKGEEASTKLLLPMFGMLGVIMVMVVAPAFLSLG